MCGIAGILNRGKSQPEAELLTAVSRMAGVLHHRGPDDAGIWSSAAAGVAFGHQRLSVIDLSACGHQPMVSRSGRWVIVFNGEIYNYQELRAELQKSGTLFRGHSDTETLLEAADRWGVEKMLEKIEGMFAFGLWDQQARTLTLARDRMGEKPLYYGWAGMDFLFASELKSFHQHPAFQKTVDPEALALFLRYSCVPSPYSIYKNIFKLEPGMRLTLSASSHPGSLPQPEAYWSLQAVAGKLPAPYDDEREMTERLEALLKESVKRQMLSDVPLGVFLSGGIDSSLIAALMQMQSSTPVRTFTVGFEEAKYDEAPYAKQVAKHLKTEHHELYLNSQELLDVIPRLPRVYDEPFADSSQIPTFLIAQFARRHVTVCLSGDGGDELFGGYRRYYWLQKLWRLQKLPAAMRFAAACLIKGLLLLPGHWNEKASRLAFALTAKSPERLYQRIIPHWQDPESALLHQVSRSSASFMERRLSPDSFHFLEKIMLFESGMHLPDTILVKLDRASMAVGLEARAPFLDRRVVEFAWGLPLSMKISGGKGKRILRKLLSRFVPDALVDRPKAGFDVPLARWLRGPLKNWAGDLLSEERLKRQGFFKPQVITSLWKAHLSGLKDAHYPLWDVLMFQAWLEEWA